MRLTLVSCCVSARDDKSREEKRNPSTQPTSVPVRMRAVYVDAIQKKGRDLCVENVRWYLTRLCEVNIEIRQSRNVHLMKLFSFVSKLIQSKVSSNAFHIVNLNRLSV